jgi:hypothetical protein
MTNVATPITSSDATSVALRPTRSPKCPNSTDPTGRATNATPKTANEASSAVAWLCAAKKTVGKTSTAAVA